jgi:tRNA modification GTPase
LTEHGFWFHRASPRGEGGVALFELYGGAAEPAFGSLFRPRRPGPLPEAGAARLGDVLLASGEPLDEAILARVPAAASWSGLECWTLAVHGGVWIQEALERRLEELGGVERSAAETLRAALRLGAVDAIRASAYLMLLEARTETAAAFFLRQYEGELSLKLREIIARLETGERELPRTGLHALLQASGRAFRLGHPLRLLIAGRPNAGKSTLFNRFVEDERAAVTPVPGTTRDTVEEPLVLDGFPVVVADSAGLRWSDAVGEAERKGIEKALARAMDDDDEHVIFLVPYPWTASPEERELLARVPPGRRLLVASLSDLGRAEDAARLGPDVVLSARTGAGLEDLKRAIAARWLGAAAGARADPRPGAAARAETEAETEAERGVACAPFTRRQREILERALEAIEKERGRGRSGADLDGARALLVQCIQSSWPEGPS